jgi:hypothetical protein
MPASVGCWRPAITQYWCAGRLARETGRSGYDQHMNASAWFMIGVFVLFAIGMIVAALLGARRDRQVEADVRRESRRRLGLFHRRPGNSS